MKKWWEDATKSFKACRGNFWNYSQRIFKVKWKSLCVQKKWLCRIFMLGKISIKTQHGEFEMHAYIFLSYIHCVVFFCTPFNYFEQKKLWCFEALMLCILNWNQTTGKCLIGQCLKEE